MKIIPTIGTPVKKAGWMILIQEKLLTGICYQAEQGILMETITSGIQKSPLVSTEKSDLLEAGGTIRTVLNVSKDASERKLFTDSYSLSNKLLNLFYKDKEYPEMSAQQKKKFLGFYCKIKIKKLEQLNSQLAKMEQKKSISGSIFSTSLDPAKETQKNEALILAFNDLAQMDSPVIIQQLLNTLRVNPRYIEEVHAPIHAKILLVKQHCANLKKLMIAENKALSQSNEIELVTLISTHVSQVLFELDQHWSHSFICNKYHEKYVSKPGTMVAASSDILQSMITKLSEQHTQLTTIIEKATQSNPEITP